MPENRLVTLPQHEMGFAVRPEVRELRRKAPDYFVSLIENGIIENVSSIQDIPSQSVIAMGGLASACYFYENNGLAEVVKFGTLSSEAESIALNAWKARGASVPEVKSSGIVPGADDKTKYIVLEGVTTDDGECAPTGEAFLAEQPHKTQSLGTAMGRELAKMHTAETDLPFGGFADVKSPNAATAAEYYGIEISTATRALEESGIHGEQIDSLQDVLSSTNFPERGVFVHGDYGPHNVLVNASDPIEIKAFDPAPRVADPYWDLARITNQLELYESMAQAFPQDEKIVTQYKQTKQYTDALIAAYVAESGELDSQRLLANQIVTELRSIQRQVSRQPYILHETGKDTNLDPKNMYKKRLLAQRINTFVLNAA